MRKQLSVILTSLLLGLMASAAETPALQGASQRNELQRVTWSAAWTKSGSRSALAVQ